MTDLLDLADEKQLTATPVKVAVKQQMAAEKAKGRPAEQEQHKQLAELQQEEELRQKEEQPGGAQWSEGQKWDRAQYIKRLQQDAREGGCTGQCLM